MAQADSTLIELNVSGVHYTATAKTLKSQPSSLLAKWITPGTPESAALPKDSKGRYFIERDGQLFRFILDFLRSDGNLILPEGFCEMKRLQNEARSLGVELSCDSSSATCVSSDVSSSLAMTAATNDPLLKPGSTNFATSPCTLASSAAAAAAAVAGGVVAPSAPGASGYISLGYRGSFAFGRDGLADVKFRKLTKILVCGKVSLCREVFGESLNESRDPDHGQLDLRYSARFFLKHTVLEQAFDALQDAGFHMVGSCASGTGPTSEPLKPGIDSEESRWNHYNEFIFCRP